jgi:fused signal recognition particle receptor
MGLFDFFSKEKKESLDKGLEKSKTSIFDKLSRAIIGKSKVDDEVLDELEEILISSDVGVETTVKIIRRIEARVERDKYTTIEELDRILREETAALLAENNSQDVKDSFETDNLPKPYVLLVVGVNGVGKTTTIGKLAHQFQKRGKKVVLGAADTFRAAAVDQLKLWGKRVGVEVIDHGMNTDPSSVAFDAVKKGMEMNADIIIIDTAGRLHTKVNLMNELGKIKRVVQKFLPEAPHEVMLVLDGSTGQNAVIQAREFTKVTEIDSLTITKLDGTAKGGVVIGISDEFKIPVKYIGVGEQMDDLQVFNKMEFVDSLFKK